MKHKKNKALKQKVSHYTHKVGRQKIFRAHRQIRMILGTICVFFAAMIAVFPLWSLLILGIGLLFLRGPVYTERKVLRIIHTGRRIKKLIIKNIKHLFHTQN